MFVFLFFSPLIEFILEPGSHLTKLQTDFDSKIPKPTPRLTKSTTNDTNNSSISSQFDDNSLSSSITINNNQIASESEQNASDELTSSSDSFKQRKNFWESLDQVKDQHSLIPQPVPKPRVVPVKDSFDTDTSSLRSLQDSKQVSRDEDSYVVEDRLEDESFPISERYDSDISDTKKDEKMTKKKQLITDLDNIDVCEADDEEDEATKAARFYIGESSENVIIRSATDKLHEFSFDIDNNELSLDDDGNSIPLKVKETDFVHETIEIFDDSIMTSSIRDNVELSAHLMARSTGDDSKLDLTLEEKSEFEVSEKIKQTKSLKEVDSSKEIIAEITKSQPIIHSPIKNAMSFEMEKPIEIPNEPVTVAKAFAIEVLKDIQPEIKKLMQFESFSEMSSKESLKLDSMTSKTMGEMTMNQTSEEVVDSFVLKGVQTEIEKPMQFESFSEMSSKESLKLDSMTSKTMGEMTMTSEEVVDSFVMKGVQTEIEKPMQFESFSEMSSKESLKLDSMTSRTTGEMAIEQTLEEVEDSFVLKGVQTEIEKPMQFKSFFEMSSKESLKLDSITSRTIGEMAIEQTLEEVEDSLDAVHEELIEVVKDGKLIKQSPSEFEIKVLPDLKYPTIPIPENEEIEISNDFLDFSSRKTEVQILIKTKEPEIVGMHEKPKTSETEESQHSSNEESFNKLDVVKRRSAGHPPKSVSNRVSTTDIESSSGESYYQSFEKTDSSRPVSSDMENFMNYQSSEYDTAQDHSLVPGGSTLDYHSAVSTLNSGTISSRESMKSFESSESSGNLASMEASEASETLVPSTMEECEEALQSDLLSHQDIDLDDSNRFTSLESEITTSSKSEEVSPPIAPAMKRSHEMNFGSDVKPIIESVDLMDDNEGFKFEERLGRSVEDLKYGSWEEAKFGSSLEEGSMLSVSISSASNLETMVEIHTDQADMMGSLIGSFDSAKIYTSFTDDVASATTPPEFHTKIDNMTMISSTIFEDDQCNVNTQITSSSSEDPNEASKKRGHKRTDSTSVFAGGFIKAGSKDSSDSFEDDVAPQEESSEGISSEKDETHGESSDSDYDRYESEYARSFRSPLVGKTKAKKERETLVGEIEDKKSFSNSPGHSLIETIVEDVNLETELSVEKIETKVSQIQDYHIPDIQVTDDLIQETVEDDVKEQTQPSKTTTEPASSVVTQNVQYAKQVEYKMTEEEYQDILAKKYQSRLADITTKFEDQFEDPQQASPGSDSFEMLEQPELDLSEEFVIVEEVAKEAQEFDQEGKSLSIAPVGKYVRKHDEDVEKYIIKSAPAATDAGSAFQVTQDINFEFEDSPPQDDNADNLRGNGYPLEGSKRWVEMNLSDPSNLRYPYDMDRGILEDIKEEDTDFEVGSSRISSFKDSYSSTPDYDVLVRKIHARDHDNISMNSLQEFESLEQVISLENRQKTQSSQESLSNGSYPKRHLAKNGANSGDDTISLSSLKEFEGLENACIEAHLIEIKAKEEAALLLSRSDDSNKSSGSSNGGNKSSPRSSNGASGGGTVTRTSTTTTTIVKGKPMEMRSMEQNMAQEFHKLQQQAIEMLEDNSISIMEASTDSLEEKVSKNIYDKSSSQHVSSDSLDNVRSSNVDIMTSSVDSIEMSKEANTGKSSDVDSIEQNSPIKRRSDSIDSIEMQFAMSQNARIERDSLDDTINYEISSAIEGRKIMTQNVQRTTTTTVTSSGSGPTISSSTVIQYDMPTRDISSDSLNRTEPELLLTSTESLTSSTATNATYQNRTTDSQMSGSITSCGSNTMIDTLDSNYTDFYSPSSSSYQIHQQQQPYQSTTTTTSYAYQEHEMFDDENFSPITFNVTKQSSQSVENSSTGLTQISSIKSFHKSGRKQSN